MSPETWRQPKTITSITEDEIQDVIENGIPEESKKRLRDAGINVPD